MVEWFIHSHCCILFHCINPPDFLHSIVDGYLDCFQLLATAGSTVMIAFISICDNFDEKTKMKKSRRILKFFLSPSKVQMVTAQPQNPS